MLNKEEIENMKSDLINLHHMLGKKPSVSANAIENALEYINQLESELEMYKDIKDMMNSKVKSIKILTNKDIDKKVNERNKKLIEKLEKDIEKANTIINDKDYRYIEEVINEQYERRKLALEILKILKGENDERRRC